MRLLFLIDVSPAMGLAAPSPPSSRLKNDVKSPDFTFLDLAKIAVEFISKGCRWNKGDQFFIMTTEMNSEAVKCSWGDGFSHFEMQLKALRVSKEIVEERFDLDSAIRSGFYLINRHRLMSGVDNWGRGRLPWQVDPGVVILITHNKPEMQTISVESGPDIKEEKSILSDLLNDQELSQLTTAEAIKSIPDAKLAVNPINGEEFNIHPYRWDQRMHALVLTGEEMLLSTKRGEAINQLCQLTCGQARGCFGLAAVQIAAESLVHKLHQVGPAMVWAPLSSSAVIAPIGARSRKPSAGESSDIDITKSSESDESAQGGKLANENQAKLTRGILTARRGFASWPIPESAVVTKGWIDKQRDDQPPLRTGLPEVFFKVTSDINQPVIKACFGAEQLGIASDMYEIEWCTDAPVAAFAFCTSKAALSGDDPTRILKDSCWPVYIRAVSPNGTPLDKILHVPFGYLQGHRLAGRANFTVLPYNFPWLVHLLLQIKDYFPPNSVAAQQQGNSSGDKAVPSIVGSLGSEWRSEFKQYLASIPLYYHAALKRCLKPFGLQLLIIQDQSLERPIPQRVYTRLCEIKDAAKAKIEAINASKHPLRKKFFVDQHNSLGVNIDELMSIPIGGLLEYCENMRRGLFGGSAGLAVAGLFRTQSSKIEKSDAPGSELLLEEVSQSLAPSRTITQMSNYSDTLVAREFLRDPEPENDSYKERSTFHEMENGRVLVNFGNPFRKTKRIGRDRGEGALNWGLQDKVINLAMDEAADEAAILQPHELSDKPKEIFVEESLPFSIEETAPVSPLLASSAEIKRKHMVLSPLGMPKKFMSESAKRRKAIIQAKLAKEWVSSSQETSLPASSKQIDIVSQSNLSAQISLPALSSSSKPNVTSSSFTPPGSPAIGVKSPSTPSGTNTALPQASLGPRDYILPPGWSVQVSKKQQRDYYFNATTGEALWTLPPGSIPNPRLMNR